MKNKSLIQILFVLGLLVGLISTPLKSLASPTTGSISGTATYTGSYDPNHEVLVAAHLSVDSEPVESVHISGPGDYLLGNIPDGDYYISAFLDIHDRGEGPPEFGEPTGWYDPDGDDNPNPVTVSGGSLTGIDITMTDITDEYFQGTGCYLGGVHGPGPLEVALHVNVNDPPVVSQSISLPCDEYIFSGGPAGTYYVSLLYDVDASSGPPDPGEPFGWYDENGDGNPDPVLYTGNVITDVNITIGGIHYVDYSATGNDDGKSWNDAYHDLQDALAVATPGEEIWVSAGLYTPGTTRDASFILKHGVAVYGGFNGTEDFRYQRNWGANTTILSGEVGNPSTSSDNAYHVVTTASTFENPVDRTTILDGFAISGGYANVDGGSADQDKGGGLLNRYGTPTLANLNFIDNFAYNHGGAIANQYTTEPLVVINSTFTGNSSNNNAGGIANLGASNLVIANSSIVGNTGGNGGGIVNLQGSHAEIHNVILWGNEGNEIVLQDTATVSVTYSIIEEGYAGGSNILTGNPLFVDADGADNVYGTLDDDLHLQGTSPAIDAGDNLAQLTDLGDSDGDGNTSETTPVDLDGHSRSIDDPVTPDTGNGPPPIVDMGVDEYGPPGTIGGLRAVTHDQVYRGETTIFAARVTSGTHITYAWDFGDGNIASGGVASHAYNSPGVYQVVLTATNTLGSQQASTIVTVGEVLAADPGGSSTTTDGMLTFEIPPAITSTVTITYTPQTTPTADLGTFDLAGFTFQLQAADVNGNPIIEPGTPYTLTIHYDATKLPPGTDEEDLELRRYDETSGVWAMLTILSRDTEMDTLVVQLDHFSEFALIMEQPVVIDHKIYLPLLKK